ncbi:hypothetical protein AMK15_35280 [Streptomyces sp. MJM1172]|nr:hypothetical protein AMK15_35280 [Streptomyces sp. MJM1172]
MLEEALLETTVTVLPDREGLRMVQCAGECDLRLMGPLPCQLARLLTLTGTNQVLSVDDDDAASPTD